MSPSTCNHCGAPREPGLAVCRYCRTPLVANVSENAVPCPSCGLLHEKGAQKCSGCAAWLVVQCVFCGKLSPHNEGACVKCDEPFAGAIERFQQRKQTQESQQRLNMVASVGGVAAGLLGAFASTGIVEHVATAVRSSDDDDDDDRRQKGHGAYEGSCGSDEGESGKSGGFFDSLLQDTDPSDDGAS
jgi:hypothetical protein